MSCLVLRHHTRPPTAFPPSTCNAATSFWVPAFSVPLSVSLTRSLFLFLLLPSLSRSRFPCDIVYSRVVNYTRSRMYVYILIHASGDTINGLRGKEPASSRLNCPSSGNYEIMNRNVREYGIDRRYKFSNFATAPI